MDDTGSAGNVVGTDCGGVVVIDSDCMGVESDTVTDCMGAVDGIVFDTSGCEGTVFDGVGSSGCDVCVCSGGVVSGCV